MGFKKKTRQVLTCLTQHQVAFSSPLLLPRTEAHSTCVSRTRCTLPFSLVFTILLEVRLSTDLQHMNLYVEAKAKIHHLFLPPKDEIKR